jgi:hypothetical protein
MLRVTDYTELRDPPSARRKHCNGGKEQCVSEGAVMIAFALYLLENGATSVNVHPDGEHAKRYDLKTSLEAHGFARSISFGTTSYAGVYHRGTQTITIKPQSGCGDVVSDMPNGVVVAECKGGVINSSHAGQNSRLRRGLCEAVGLLIARPLSNERHMAVVLETATTERVALRMLTRARAAGIEIALVAHSGQVRILSVS